MSLRSIFTQNAWTETAATARRAAKEARGREYKRTCQRCEHVWYMPGELVHERAPNKLEMAGQRITTAGKNASLISFTKRHHQAKLDRLEDQVQRVQESKRCPSCGSISFAQELV